MASSQDNDLIPEQTEGFKVGEKKTIDEYKQMGMYSTLRRCSSDILPHASKHICTFNGLFLFLCEQPSLCSKER